MSRSRPRPSNSTPGPVREFYLRVDRDSDSGGTTRIQFKIAMEEVPVSPADLAKMQAERARFV